MEVIAGKPIFLSNDEYEKWITETYHNVEDKKIEINDLIKIMAGDYIFYLEYLKRIKRVDTTKMSKNTLVYTKELFDIMNYSLFYVNEPNVFLTNNEIPIDTKTYNLSPDVYFMPNGSRIFQLFNKKECNEIISYFERFSNHYVDMETIYGEKRTNKRIMIMNETFASFIFTKLKRHNILPENIIVIENDSMIDNIEWNLVGLNNAIRFCKYDTGDRFGDHRDGRFEITETLKSQLTMNIFLNDEFDGGEFCFVKSNLQGEENIIVKPVAGQCVLFRSTERHRGNIVTSGKKYIVRFDVMYQIRQEL